VSETIRCRGCGMMLYFGEEIKRRLYMRAIPSEETVLGYYDNLCPRCKSKLSLESVEVTFSGRHHDGP
jgi:phage FluMu protein Com